MKGKIIDKQTVKKIANLARLDLGEHELEKYSQQLCSILEFVSQIEAEDSIELDKSSILYDFDSTVLREDNIKEGFSQEDALLNTNTLSKSKKYFSFKKVL